MINFDVIKCSYIWLLSDIGSTIFVPYDIPEELKKLNIKIQNDYYVPVDYEDQEEIHMAYINIYNLHHIVNRRTI